MTPEEKALAAAFLAECWAVVRESHQTRDERDDARARNGLLTESCGEPELPLGIVA